MIYTTGTIAISGNTVTGTGTNFTAAGSLIRIGCTVLTMTSPPQAFQITGITSATQMTVTPAASPALAVGTKYSILLSDSLSVDGLAQDIAETFSMYQRNISGFADVMNGTGDVTITVDGKPVIVPGQKSLAKKGVNSDITEIKGLKVPLSVAQGGTGGTTAADIRKNAGLSNNDKVSFTTITSTQAASGFATASGHQTGGLNPCIATLSAEDGWAMIWRKPTDNAKKSEFLGINAGGRVIFRKAVGSDSSADFEIWHAGNTTKASDGTLKAASPVARIANPDSCTRPDIDENGFEWCGFGVANDEARGIEIIRDEIGVYRVTGAKSLASSGWRLLPPRDPDGSGDLGVVTAKQIDDEIIVSLFRRKLLLVDGEIVTQPGEPIDVPVNSWIDVRLDMPRAAIPAIPPLSE